jgi:helix-turn-helix protein
VSEERKLADTTGKFVQVVVDGNKVNDLEWLSGRILLSNRRLVLASGEGKKTIALSKIQSMNDRRDVNEAISPVSGYLSVQIGADVHLVAPDDVDSFAESLYTALLGSEVVLAKHPAVEGGVVQDTDWEKARLSIEPEEVGLGLSSGQFVEIELADVGLVETATKHVAGSERDTIEIEHTLGDDTSVETHISGTRRHVAILESLVRQGESADVEEADLDQTEHEVLMALYSGVSPFEIPDFVGLDVEEVEEIYDRLVEAGFLEKERVRREVTLKARGRNIAGEAISDQ